MGPTGIYIADDFHPLLLNRLDEAAIPYIYAPDSDRAAIISALEAGAPGLIIRSKTPVDSALLSAAKNLKFIGRGGSGMDNIDLQAVAMRGIHCFNAGAANADAVGEHTIGMLLSLMHNLSRADAEVRNRIWLRGENRGDELMGKTVGIIGYGNTGSAVARKLAGLGVNIIAYDKYKSGFGSQQVREVSLEDIFREADILTLHVPLTPETRLMVNSDFIQRFVRKFRLLNLSRGEVVSITDVLNAMENNHIIGFAADVLECENFARFGPAEEAWFSRLSSRRDVVLAPHVGGWTFQSYERISAVLADEIIRLHSPVFNPK